MSGWRASDAKQLASAKARAERIRRPGSAVMKRPKSPPRERFPVQSASARCRISQPRCAVNPQQSSRTRPAPADRLRPLRWVEGMTF